MSRSISIEANAKKVAASIRARGKRVHALDGYSIVIGFQGQPASSPALQRDSTGATKPVPGLNVATLAAIHQFGTKSAGKNRNVEIIARPFMTLGFHASIDKVKSKYASLVRSLSGKGKGSSILQRLANIGALVSSSMEEQLTNLRSNPYYALKESTKKSRLARFGKRGGDPSPLIDTGQLRQSIGFAVRRMGQTIRQASGQSSKGGAG